MGIPTVVCAVMTKALRLPTFSCPTSLGLRSVLRRSLLAPDLRASAHLRQLRALQLAQPCHRVLLPTDFAVEALLDLANPLNSRLEERLVRGFVKDFVASLHPLHGVANRACHLHGAYFGGVCQPHRLRCAIQHLLHVLWASLLRNRLKRG
jgi:hypothetical protein